MLDTQGQWSEALSSNNIRAIIRWLWKLTTEGEVDVEEILQTFSCWVQRTSEFAKKELLTLCFSRCHGLWMFLDRSSFTRVHMLLQRLRNLLTLAQWARRQLSSAHFWHGVGVPCAVCRDTCGSSDVRLSCWTQEHRALKQHIWLGQLVQWWGIMGLLPKYPEAHELKRITQMWKEMDQSHRKVCLETPGCEEGEKKGFRSLIQGMVTQLDRQHGCIWISEDCRDQCYPPPSLQALLKLLLVPHIDTMSVQGLLMYFVLDMANFLQCKDDLLQSFCHAFTIPSSFSQQIRAFWMLDHGHVKAAMKLLLSPRAAVPALPWQHRCIIHCLLTRKQPQLALRYLHWTKPAIQSIGDAKLYAGVLLQNSCASDAWALLKRGHTESEDMVLYFLQACDGFGLCAETLKYILAGYTGEEDNVRGIDTTGSQLSPMGNTVGLACPLSARLYQAQRVNAVSSEELVQLVRKAAMEVRKPQHKISEMLWPKYREKERKPDSREMFLTTQALHQLTPSPSPEDMLEETEQTAHTEDAEDKQPHHNHHESPGHMSFSLDLNSESVSSFTSASSLPLLRRDPPYVYESTLTMQRISSLLTDGENQSRDEEDEERDSQSPSSMEALTDCPHLALTLEGDTDSVFRSSSITEALVDVELSLEAGEEDFNAGVFPSKDFLCADAVSGPSMNETLPLNESIDDQSVPSLCEAHLETPSLLPLDDEEKTACCEGVSEQTVHGSPDVSVVSLKDEDQSDYVPCEIFSEAAASDCFQEEQPHEDLLTDLHQSFLSEDPEVRGSAGRSQQEISLQIFHSSLTLRPNCDIKTCSAPSDIINESSFKAQLKTDEHCVQNTGRLWKQDLETGGASPGLLPAASDNQSPSLVLSQPYPQSLLNFMDFSAKQRGDNRDGKQADKEEPAGWSSSGRGPQGAIRSERTRSRKGKRVKRA